jgi:hypothetical protein
LDPYAKNSTPPESDAANRKYGYVHDALGVGRDLVGRTFFCTVDSRRIADLVDEGRAEEALLLAFATGKDSSVVTAIDRIYAGGYLTNNVLGLIVKGDNYAALNHPHVGHALSAS